MEERTKRTRTRALVAVVMLLEATSWWWGLVRASLQEGLDSPPFNNGTIDSGAGDPRTILITTRLFHVDIENIHLTAPQLIIKHGYPLEVHSVTTKDGYILTMHRIPSKSGSGRPAVLFHGMFQSSRDFLMQEGARALPYKLYDSGYDVWLANARGSQYSREHVRLNANTLGYWLFSVDEVVRFDAPSIIDYVLAASGAPDLTWIGYSLGTAVGLGLTSTITEYNSKISDLVLLGTTAYVGRCKSPVLRLLAPFERVQTAVMSWFNHGETLPLWLLPLMRTLLPVLCLPEGELDKPGFCSAFLWLVAGISVQEANPRLLSVLMGGTPSPLSVRMLSQWYQWINCGEFTHYDFGSASLNQAKYGMSKPPSYDLSRVTTRVVNFYAENDWLSVPADVMRTVKELKNVAYNIRVELPTFNHLDFIYGRDADVLVYDRIIDVIGVSKE